MESIILDPKTHSHPIRWLALLLATSLLLSACGGGPKSVRPAPAESPTQRELARAGELFRQHRYAEAATRYRAIAAKRQGETRGKALLGALRSLVASGDLETARAVSNELSHLPLNEAGLAEKLLFDAHLSLESGDLEHALQTFDVIDETQLDPLQRRMLHEDKARIFAARGDRRGQAAEHILLDPLLGDPDQRALNQQTLLDELMQLRDEDLDWLDQRGTPETLGWTDLIRAARASLLDATALDRALAAWRLRHPRHPLDDTLRQQFARKLIASIAPPRSIALWLPRQGRIGKAARLIQDGLLRAYRADTRAERPSLTEYPSDEEPLEAQLRRIRDAGHDLVIGPLAKQRVSALARQDLAERPTLLALNRAVDASAPPPALFQFGLAPEDEALLAADRAWREGQRVALTLTPANPRGQRLRDAFKRHFEALGGVVAESVEYDPTRNEFTTPVKALLNIDDSERRFHALTRVLGIRLEFEPRPRPDADCIFLVAKPMAARQINPLFKFYRAGRLPVYATSMVHDGRPRPELDIDLEGVQFTDIPALLLDDENRGTNAAVVRLRALGEDAWALARQVRRMAYAPEQRLDGRTGILYSDAERRIHRLLVWARYHEGRPAVIGYAEMPLNAPPESEEDLAAPAAPELRP